jgi:hypothetical protein
LKRALFLITVVIFLIIGGYLSNTLSKHGASAIPMLKVQTENPEASPMVVTPEKGALFTIFVAIALGSVVGMGATLALAFWLINRNIARSRQTAAKATTGTPTTTTADVARVAR